MNFKRPKSEQFVSLIFILTLMNFPSSCIPKDQSQANEDCGFSVYEANCVLDIMEEHIEANAVVNHCHIPLDITFRVIYRYGNGTEQRWQYTFVTTNQNERVLIPGLKLPPAPHADVYLFVRVPHPLFDLHNSSIAAVEASFVAVLSESEWEEVEFLNEAIIVKNTKDCFAASRTRDPLLWIIGGAFLSLLFVGGITTGVLWWYRRRKIALDELALVSSLETGLPGAQPYQVETTDPRLNNNTILTKEGSKEDFGSKDQRGGQDSNKQTSSKIPGFKFGRLKEESPEEIKERIARKLDKAVVIGNPVLVDKTSVLHNRFNRMAATNPQKSGGVKNVGTVGDAFENTHFVAVGGSEVVHRKEMETSMSHCPTRIQSANDSVDTGDHCNPEAQQNRTQEKNRWEAHPLGTSGDVTFHNFKDGARPKDKIPQGRQSSAYEPSNSQEKRASMEQKSS